MEDMDVHSTLRQMKLDQMIEESDKEYNTVSEGKLRPMGFKLESHHHRRCWVDRKPKHPEIIFISR